jgi:putative ABC transport system permease protein
VIGVVPGGRRSIVPKTLAAGRHHDLWLPLRLAVSDAPRGLHFLDVIALKDPSIDLATASDRIASFARRLQEEAVTEHGIQLVALDRVVVGESRPLLFALAGAVAMLLLIACTNVANLLLARSAARQREIAVRAALGAARPRLVRQLLVESLLLALLGGAVGVLVAWGSVTALRALAPGSVPRLAEATIDARVLAFALATSIVTGLLFGLLPALRSTGSDLALVMKEGTRGTVSGPARQRLRGVLIVAEVALSFALLIGAGLLVRSLDRLLRVDKGFDAERVMSAFVSLPASRYPELHQQTAFFDDLREVVAALPDVRAAAYVNNLPLDGGVNGTVVIEGREFPPDAEPLSEKRIVSPGYFDVLRTPVLAGRSFDQRDRAGSPPVVIVNRAFAARFFPGESALGKRVDFAWETEGMQEIVGVVEDVRERELHLPASPTMYIPHAQRPEEDGFLVVRASGDPHLLVPAMRAALATLDGTLPLSEVRTLEAVLAEGLAERRLATSLFGVFSLVSLALAAIGLYAVISYTVLQRRQEIGIRMALGARGRQVIRTVLGQGLGLIAAGVALGALAALSLGRFLSALLFGVDAADPVTFGGVALLLIAIALLASIVPALRAARLDPASVLRSE